MNKVLFRKIERLKEEVFYLETNKAKLLRNIESSLDIKKITERSVYLCSEIAIDIADMIISIKNLPKPSTYSDTIYKLGEYKIVPKVFARKFVYIAGLRNFLAHDYQIDTVTNMKKFLRYGIADVKKFISYIEKI